MIRQGEENGGSLRIRRGKQGEDKLKGAADEEMARSTVAERFETFYDLRRQTVAVVEGTHRGKVQEKDSQPRR